MISKNFIEILEKVINEETNDNGSKIKASFSDLQKIAELTDDNEHFESRIFISELMKDDTGNTYKTQYKKLAKLHDAGNNMVGMRNSMEKEFYEAIKKRFSNAKEIISNL